MEMRRSRENEKLWAFNFCERMGEELYDISKDVDCVGNLVLNPEYVLVADNLIQQMEEELKKYSDDGFAFGEHGLIDKRHFFRKSVKIPLLERIRELIARGRQICKMVQNIDVPPTNLDFEGFSRSFSRHVILAIDNK